ncbi:uncharacterized protein LOC142882069 isoform X4 [Nelusetta ayraudi]|uniref:uncharacterized protein LOC142882069 isoform X4 n=1 Tax=Nelusetta ayraudi TaxID=303726 RepID=UPI003F6F1B44
MTATSGPGSQAPLNATPGPAPQTGRWGSRAVAPSQTGGVRWRGGGARPITKKAGGGHLTAGRPRPSARQAPPPRPPGRRRWTSTARPRLFTLIGAACVTSLLCQKRCGSSTSMGLLMQTDSSSCCRGFLTGTVAWSPTAGRRRWEVEVAPPPHARLIANQSAGGRREHLSSLQRPAVSRSSVVCVKFPPQAVDEVFLRRLAERFGPVVQVLMFPSLAFMELGSAQQAQDLVRFHQEEPPTVQGQQMEFRVSHTFSFPQSSRVVSFSPAPPAGGKLMALVRGFGSPLYMLVLPSAVLVEMEEATDAQKLLDHFSSDSLKIDGEAVTVTFSREFRSLTRVTGALKCQEGGGGGGSSSREQGSSNRTWSRSSTGSGSPGSQVAPAAPPAGEAEPEKDSESSAESDIEGMEVIAANLEDDDLENLEEEEEQEEVPQQEVDSPADLKNYCTTLDQLEEDTATAELHEATSASSHQPCLGRGAAADTSSSREKRPHGPEASKRSLEKEQQRRSSPRRRCGSSEESAAPEESAPPPDWSHDSPWTRSRGRAAVEEQGAAGPEETLRRRASSQNHKEPEEKKRRSSSTAEQELSHQQGATSTPELLEDSQSQQAEPAGGATEHQNPAQPVGTEFVRPVVGYFCHLCQVIFADEDEAKGQHCSSPAHYRKYQEKTGRDPWR